MIVFKFAVTSIVREQKQISSRKCFQSINFYGDKFLNKQFSYQTTYQINNNRMVWSQGLDTVQIQFGVYQNGKVRLFKTCKFFITMTKHSNLFLLDRHKNACARCQLLRYKNEFLSTAAAKTVIRENYGKRKKFLLALGTKIRPHNNVRSTPH